ncbi:MAG: hypothetical protein RML93_03035, partial [Anaerolineales bacterium]|nr:hypothetical protein [Anaerolineales bacterium]MDW8446248.1 hypothetical protein [Anaerolineales bacterium]
EIVRRHEERLASVEERLASVEDRLSRLEATVAELIEIVRRHEERLASVEERLASVEERLASVEDRLSRLEATVAELAEAQKRSEERLTRLEKVVLELTEAQSRTERQVQRLVDRLGHISGDLLEIKYRDKPTAYFGRIVRQAQLVDLADVEGLVQEHLSEEEVIDLLQIDLVVRGRLRKPLWKEREAPEVWLAVEVSSVVDREDLERAYRRAQLLRRAGLLVLPVAAGQSSTLGAQAVAKAKGIVLQADGWFECLDEALERLKEG